MMIITIVSIAIAMVAVISAADIDLPNVNPSGQTVSVNGEYTATTEPTEATIVIGFENEADTAAAAQKENSDEMANVLVALRKAGLSDDDFKTLNYNLWDRPVCETGYYGRDDSDCESTYHASHTLEVTTDKLDLVGIYLDAAIEGGANNIHNVRFSVSEEEQNELKADALEKATRDARTKADALAAGMGLKVYRVISISDSSWDYGVHRMAYAEIEEASAVAGGVHADTQILAGDVEVSARVYAEFELA